MRRWLVIGLAALAALALACDGGAAVTAPDSPRDGLPSSMAALGDSITAGVGSCITLRACPRSSWSTGTDTVVHSHYQRIVAANPKMRGHAHNFAVPGARARDLPAQADEAVRAKVAYVTILIGANDACADSLRRMTPVADFRASIDDTLARLKKGLPTARLLLASVPDLYRLWETGHNNRAAQLAWRAPECQALLSRPSSTAAADDERRHAVAERVDEYNTALVTACDAYGSQCRWDRGDVHDAAFTLDQVAIDYFHPNRFGQRELAAATYPANFAW